MFYHTPDLCLVDYVENMGNFSPEKNSSALIAAVFTWKIAIFHVNGDCFNKANAIEYQEGVT